MYGLVIVIKHKRCISKPMWLSGVSGVSPTLVTSVHKPSGYVQMAYSY